jgi:hypothetical protein
MKLNRRKFLQNASLGAACLAAGDHSLLLERGKKVMDPKKNAYKYRIAFGAWINDMRNDPLPLQNWPAPQLDDETVASAIQALDVQSAAGFNLLDVWGLFATYAWPPDIVSAVDKDRRRKINRLIRAADDRGMKLSLGLGTYSWGYDQIIEADPDVRGKDPSGQPHAHAMCDANPKSFEYVRKIIDFTLSEFDFGAVHLESCDLGCCFCPECAGKDGVVGYNVRINQKTADYIKSRWPDQTVYVITINWVPPLKHLTAEEMAQVLALGKHIDCLFDQGHCGYHVPEAERAKFIRQLGCDYGTSGGLWLYPDVRWDRASYFLPYVRRTAAALRQLYDDGGRGCMYYQGPVSNPSTEVNVAAGGRILSDIRRDPAEVLAEVIELTYRPKNAAAHRKLLELYQRAEDGYFSQWKEELFKQVWGIPVPGEFKLDQHLFGTSPGPATLFVEPGLDTEGRLAYKQALVSILEELPALRGSFADHGRLDRIRRSLIITLNLINTIAYVKGESKVLAG